MKGLLLHATALIISASALRAGITIHFEGTAGSSTAVAQIIEVAKTFSVARGWRVIDASAADGTLERVIDEKNKDYKGRITGIRIHPGPKCEPINIQFGDDLFMQDFVKTQFAGADVHIEVIALFDELKPHFAKLGIIDESEYWDTRNKEVLEGHISKIDSIIKEMKQSNPSAKGPVFLPSGRIADITE